MSDDLPELSGPEAAPVSGKAPDRLIIFLHGLGANGQDLIGLAPVLGPVFPDAQFLSPDAPFPCDMAPMGLQWFSFQEQGEDALWTGVLRAAPTLDAYLDAQMARFDLPPERVALVGFSQGTMMSLHVAPRRKKPVAGVLGFSGMLIGADHLPAEAQSHPPIHLIHGDSDPVVPVQMTENASEALKRAGFDVGVTICPGLPHSIDETGLRAGAVFLSECFGDT